MKEFAKAKFRESVDVAVNLGIDASKSDQQVRGSTVMPHGIGKSVRVAVFTSGKNQDAARAAGADIVGLEDLAEKVKAGEMNFDVVVASPDAMRVVGQLGQILGPRGLMPNPKVGTVTPNVAEAVKNAKAGQVRYRSDKAGVVHCTIGKADFDAAEAQGKSDRAAAGPAEGQAGGLEGHLSEEGFSVLDHGPRRAGGTVVAVAKLRIEVFLSWDSMRCRVPTRTGRLRRSVDATRPGRSSKTAGGC